MIKKINHNNELLAVIIYSEFNKDGIEFFTPDNFSQQLGYMKRPKDYIIDPHVHNPVPRNVTYTQEVLIVKSGKIRVDFYDDKKEYIESYILKSGDVVLLAFGGHGFQMIEESEIIEVKQGPYAGEEDKIRFTQVKDNLIKIQK